MNTFRRGEQQEPDSPFRQKADVRLEPTVAMFVSLRCPAFKARYRNGLTISMPTKSLSLSVTTTQSLTSATAGDDGVEGASRSSFGGSVRHQARPDKAGVLVEGQPAPPTALAALRVHRTTVRAGSDACLRASRRG